MHPSPSYSWLNPSPALVKFIPFHLNPSHHRTFACEPPSGWDGRGAGQGGETGNYIKGRLSPSCTIFTTCSQWGINIAFHAARGAGGLFCFSKIDRKGGREGESAKMCSLPPPPPPYLPCAVPSLPLCFVRLFMHLRASPLFPVRLFMDLRMNKR